ncbi:MAG TPA: peptidyl-alpha-hydroxyglycine alpha-amidating lyase family protein [Gemmatimonadaceae bacterium]|jgi:sugar lactone lactonase YvrE|nr:peptidyl-alpha-hydroxyglycine alpha-amidating lyase family protein [Gemmatimonadaceae bacterium]
MQRRASARLILLVAIAAPVFARVVGAQETSIRPQNDLPNPYRTLDTWAKMPGGRTWGSASAVDIDKDGVSIWVAERCGANNCATSTLDPVMKFDTTGNVVAHFGSGLIVSPHGIFVDRDGNIWVTDCNCTGGGGGRRGGGRGDTSAAGRAAAPPTAPAGPPKGHQIFKFSPDGKLLLTMGVAGGGRDTAYFFQPNDILVAPNGTIFVAEGHSSGAGSTARVFKFSKEGKLITTWGQLGKGPDDFDQPHALAMDSRGRLFVGDRGNNRIKIFDQDGKLLDTWYQFSRPSGIAIDAQDNIYVADSESGSVNPAHGAWKRGIRIGSAKDGSVKYFIPDPNTAATNTSSAEGVAVDKRGNIYGAEVGPQTYGADAVAHIKKYVKP